MHRFPWECEKEQIFVDGVSVGRNESKRNEAGMGCGERVLGETNETGKA